MGVGNAKIFLVTMICLAISMILGFVHLFVTLRKKGTTKFAEYLIRNNQNGILYGHNKDYDNLENEEMV